MTVSNKDRDQAIALAAEAIKLRNQKPWTHSDMQQYLFEGGDVVDRLIAHGWGPTKAAVIEELQLWLESGRVREQGLVGAWEFEVRIAYLRGEDHPMMPRRKGVTDDRTE